MLNGILGVENYKQMRFKICFWVFSVLLIHSMIMSRNGCGIETIIGPLPSISIDVFFLGNINFSILVIPFIASALSYVLIIHDKISDMFKIRYYFDFHYIFSPMIGDILGLDPHHSARIFDRNRGEIMRTMFYKYASSADGELSQQSQHP